VPTSHKFVHGIDGKLNYQPLTLPTDTPSGTPVDWDLEQYSMNWSVETDDITHSGAGGAQVILGGIERLDGDIVFVYDTLHEPTLTPQVFKPRSWAYLTLMPDGENSYKFAALISSVSFSSGPKAGSVRVTAHYMSYGPITTPVTPGP
jgi:hypothetical protein